MADSKKVNAPPAMVVEELRQAIRDEIEAVARSTVR